MTQPADKSFAFDISYDNKRYVVTCIAQVIKINDSYHFSGTYEVKLHGLLSEDASFLYNYDQLTKQWEGTLLAASPTIHPTIREIIGEEILNRYK